MDSFAFIPVSVSSSLTTLRSHRPHLGLSRISFRPVSHTARKPRSSRIFAADKLYPDPLPVEPNENPLENDQDSSPVINSSYLEQLNRATANRRGASTTNTSLDPSSAPTSPPTQHGSVLSAAMESKPTHQPNQDNPSSPPPKSVAAYAAAARALWRIGWATWWVQLILTVISAIIVLFSFSFPSVDVRSSASAAGVILSTLGTIVAFVSLVWTYSYTRLSLWLSSVATEDDIKLASSRISRRLRFGLIIALMGLSVSILGLQAIIGTLLTRLLTSGFGQRNMSSQINSIPASLIQPIDILVVQASANVILALLVSVITTTWFRGRAITWEEKAKA